MIVLLTESGARARGETCGGDGAADAVHRERLLEREEEGRGVVEAVRMDGEPQVAAEHDAVDLGEEDPESEPRRVLEQYLIEAVEGVADVVEHGAAELAREDLDGPRAVLHVEREDVFADEETARISAQARLAAEK